MKDTITFGLVSVSSPEFHSCTVEVNGAPVCELMLDPTAELREWYSHASTVRLNCGRLIEIEDCDYERSLRETKRYLVSSIRGQLSAQIA